MGMQLIEGLRDQAGVTSGRLWFHGEGDSGLARMATGIAIGVSLAMGVGLFLSPAIGSAIQVAVLVFFVHAWTRPPSRYAVHKGELYAGREHVHKGPVRVTGVTGGGQHVYVGERLVFHGQPLGELSGVSVDGITELTTRLASALDVERIDERNLPNLRMWEQSAAYRTQQLLTWAREDARVRIPELKSAIPVRPGGDSSLDGVRYEIAGWSLHLDARSVNDVALESIDEVALIDNQLGRRLQLMVRCGAERITLLDVENTSTTVAHLRFVEDAIRQSLARELGSKDDLPDALRQLRSTATTTV